MQVFHQAIKNVPEFDGGPIPLSDEIKVVGRGNAQSYIILFGSYKNETEPPMITALNMDIPASACTFTVGYQYVLFSMASLIVSQYA